MEYSNVQVEDICYILSIVSFHSSLMTQFLAFHFSSMIISDYLIIKYYELALITVARQNISNKAWSHTYLNHLKVRYHCKCLHGFHPPTSSLWSMEDKIALAIQDLIQDLCLLSYERTVPCVLPWMMICTGHMMGTLVYGP